MNKNRMLALILAIAMLFALAAPGALSLAEETVTLAPVPEPEPTAKNAESGSADAADVDVIAPVEGQGTAPAATEPSASGQDGTQGGGEINQPVVPIPVAPDITPPPSDGPVPKPASESAAVAKDTEVTYTVTFYYMDANGVQMTHVEQVVAGANASVPTVPSEYTDASGRVYRHTGWSTSFTNVQSNLTVNAKYAELTSYDPEIADYYLMNYSGKPDSSVMLELPVVVAKRDDPNTRLYSNALLDGTQLTRYNEKGTPDKFDQSLVTSYGITEMKLSIDTTDLSEMPFTSASVTTANGKRGKPYVVQRCIEETSYYGQYGFSATDSANRGFATFDLKVKSSAKNGTYAIPLILEWIDADGEHDLTFEAAITITGQKSSSGGSSGGTATTTEKATPKARLIIEKVRTDPPNPKAGDEFEIVLTLTNTSKSLYLQNMELSYEVTDDYIMPADEATNVDYIPKLAANASMERRIRVQSQKDIPGKLVKMTVAVDFQDQKLATDQIQQTLTIPVLPIQRTKIDAPKLPSGMSYVDQEYEIEIDVANLGKTVLYNLSAKVVSDNEDLSAGSPFFGGNVEPATSKKVALSPIPMAAGDYSATIEISYENDQGDPTVEKREFSFTAYEEPDYDYNPNDFIDTAPIEPEQPVAMQVMQVLPPWLYGAAGAVVLLVIISMAVSARKRRKRALEDDEMD